MRHDVGSRQPIPWAVHAGRSHCREHRHLPTGTCRRCRSERRPPCSSTTCRQPESTASARAQSSRHRAPESPRLGAASSSVGLTNGDLSGLSRGVDSGCRRRREACRITPWDIDRTRSTRFNGAPARANSRTVAPDGSPNCTSEEIRVARFRTMHENLGTPRVLRPCGLSRPARPPGIPADSTARPELGCASELDDVAWCNLPPDR